MICCDQCDEWYHLDCIGLTPKTSRHLKKFYCSRCRAVAAAEDPLAPVPWEDEESTKRQKTEGKGKRPAEGKGKRPAERKVEESKPEERSVPLKKAKGSDSEARKKAAEALGEVLGQNIPEGPGSVKSASIATAIENELAGLHGGVGREYRQQVRSLVFNLKLPDNEPLRQALLDGSLSPFALARMNSQDLAPAALAEYRKARDEKYFEQVVIRSENEHPLLAKKAEHLEAALQPSAVPSPPQESNESTAPPPSSPPLTPSHVTFDTFDTFDTPPPPAEGEVEVLEQPRTPDSPVGEPLPLPSFTEFVDEEGGEEEAGEQSPVANGVSGWTGFVKTDAAKSFRLVGEHITGKHVEKFLPETLTQVGRMDRVALVDYLTRITFSTSRNLTVVVFSPEAPSDAGSYAATVEYFEQRQRAAVMKTKQNSLLKEAFLIPLPPGDVPSWVEGLTPSQEPRLLGAFISLKSKSLQKEKEKVKEKERGRKARPLPVQSSSSSLSTAAAPPHSQPSPSLAPAPPVVSVPSQPFVPFQAPPPGAPTNPHYPPPFYPQAFLPTSSNQTQDSSNVFSSLLTSLQNFGQQKPPNPNMSRPNNFQQMPPQNFQNGGNFYRQ